MANMFRKVISKYNVHEKITITSGIIGAGIGIYEGVKDTNELVDLPEQHGKYMNAVINGTVGGMTFGICGLVLGFASPIIVPCALSASILYKYSDN